MQTVAFRIAIYRERENFCAAKAIEGAIIIMLVRMAQSCGTISSN